ncbi:unnamed protein product [Prunus armeniaca]
MLESNPYPRAQELLFIYANLCSYVFIRVHTNLQAFDSCQAGKHYHTLFCTVVEVAGNRSAFTNTRRKSPTTSQCTRPKSPLTSSGCSQNLKYLPLPPLPSIYRTSLASGTETSQVFSALPTLRTFRLLPFFSFLRQSTTFIAYGRHAQVKFSLTPRAERQARMSRVFTHLSC